MLTLQKLKEIKQASRSNEVVYKLLCTIIGECEQISKNPSNNEIIGVMQKIYKDNNTTLSECPVNREQEIVTLKLENEFISSYLPKQLSKEELTAIISSQISNKANLPTIMKYLVANYKGQYDSKEAINIINMLL